MRIVLLCLLLLLGPAWVAAQGAMAERIRIVRIGLYALQPIGGNHGHDAAWKPVRKLKRLAATEIVHARLCLSFGVEYIVTGSPSAAQVAIRMVTRFPAPGLDQPGARERKLQEVYSLQLAIGPVHFRSYTFDEVWELMPGVWTFEFWHKDRKLAEQTFTVVAARGAEDEDCLEKRMSVLTTGH
jgi:hypothetical protein